MRHRILSHFLECVIMAGLAGPELRADHPLDLQRMIRSGQATAAANTAFDIGRLEDAVDGELSTLARTPNVSPLVIELSFANPVTISRARINVAFGDGTWRVDGADSAADLAAGSGTFRSLAALSAVRADAWASADFVSGAPLRYFRLTTHRLVGDAYVHLREFELWTNRPVTELRPLTDRTELYPSWRIQLKAMGLTSSLAA